MSKRGFYQNSLFMLKRYSLFVFLLFIVGQPCGKEGLKLISERDNVPTGVSLKAQKINPKGKFNGLVILVEFSDTYFTISNPSHRFWAMLNIEKYGYQGSHGSVRDYFIANSDSLFFPNFNVVGPVKLPKPMAYYGQNGENKEEVHAAEMVMDACKLASAHIDFSDYDSNNDGLVDMVYIFFASYCENENQSKKEYIWAHAGNITDSCLILADKTIGRYACSSEYIGKDTDESPLMATIGTFCHEFSHVLGLPDFYNTLSGSGLTLGSLSVMDRGNYLDKGRCPVGYSAFEREYIQWMDIPAFKPSDTIISIKLSPVSGYSHSDTLLYAFKIAIPDTQEYFYFENRQAEKWDRYLPGTGLLIYHVDLSDEEAWDRNEVNTKSSHPNYQLIRSGLNSRFDYQYVPFPGKDNKTSFSSPSVWNGGNAKFELQNIRENGNCIEFSLIWK